MQIVNFRAILRKVSQLRLVEEGPNYHLTLKNLVRFDIKNTYKYPKLTYFWWEISLNMSIKSKNVFLSIQAYEPISKIYLVHLTQNCSLRLENHAFVKVELADFCCVVSRKIFRRDSVLAYFSTLW